MARSRQGHKQCAAAADGELSRRGDAGPGFGPGRVCELLRRRRVGVKGSSDGRSRRRYRMRRRRRWFWWRQGRGSRSNSSSSSRRNSSRRRARDDEDDLWRAGLRSSGGDCCSRSCRRRFLRGPLRLREAPPASTLLDHRLLLRLTGLGLCLAVGGVGGGVGRGRRWRALVVAVVGLSELSTSACTSTSPAAAAAQPERRSSCRKRHRRGNGAGHRIWPGDDGRVPLPLDGRNDGNQARHEEGEGPRR